MKTYRAKDLILILALALMAGCGGGGGGGTSTPNISWSWIATPVVTFSQGTAGTIDLAGYVSNPANVNLTYAVASGTLPAGVMLSGSRVIYDGTAVQATSTAAFRATSGTAYVDSPSASIAITLAADTVAPTVPQNLTLSDITPNSITLNWSESTDPPRSGQVGSGMASYRVYRNGGELPSSGLLTQYIDSVSPQTTYTYRVSAVDVAGNESAQSSPANATTPGSASGVMYWQDGFESGSTSAWGGTSGTGWTVLANGEAYNGTYHIGFPLTNGTTNDRGIYHNYGTPGQVGTQIRNFYAQFAFSYDGTFGISGGEQKLAIFQYYRESEVPDPPSFTNSKRTYQVIPAVDDATGKFIVALAQWRSESNGSLVQWQTLSQNTLNVTPTIDSWDTLRIQVQLDTNGSGNLGAGNGNGIIRVWVNNTLIVEYTNVNICNGEAGVGMGRMLMTPTHAPNTWTAPSTNLFYDRFQVASDAGSLDEMLASARPR